MNRLSGFLGVAATWTVALAGWVQAGTAQHGKLTLVRMEPWQGGKMPEEEALLRYVTPQTCRWQAGTDGSWSVLPDSGEDNFKDVVKREPARYVADHPLRGTVKLGSKFYGFVLDHKDGKSKGYDRLYFDLNGNGDLSNATPVDAFEPKAPQGQSPGGAPASEFPRVDLTIDVDGEKLDYGFFFQAGVSGQEKDGSAYALLRSAVYRRGEIALEGKMRKIVVLDNNSNGRFDNVTAFAADIHGSDGQIYATYGDVLVLEAEPGAAAKPPPPRGQRKQFLGKTNRIGGKFYELKVSPLGDDVTCALSLMPVGRIATSLPRCNLEIVGDGGHFALDLEKSRPVEIPAGYWRVLTYTLTTTGWKDPAKGKAAKKTEEGDAGESSPSPAGPSTLSARGTQSGPSLEVEPNRTAMLKIGPPYKLRVTVSVRSATSEEQSEKAADSRSTTASHRTRDRPDFAGDPRLRRRNGLRPDRQRPAPRQTQGHDPRRQRQGCRRGNLRIWLKLHLLVPVAGTRGFGRPL